MTATETAVPRTRAFALPPLLRAMRPYQWPKNAIVFAALAFSAGDAWTVGDAGSWWPLLWRSLVLFALWCLAASSTYLVNDVRDREADRFHPRKARRPIASGEVSPRSANLLAAALIVVSVTGAFLLESAAGVLIAGYIALMLAYSAGLKRVPILDLIILCGGVIGRAVAGAVAIDVEISPWLYVCSSFGAFFFATSKRWSEFRQLGADAALHRSTLGAYGGELLGQMLTISAAGALLAYALYTIESRNVPANGSMALTLPFVGFALFRYLLLLTGERKSDAPDQIVFTDPQILVAVGGFVATAIIVLVAARS